MVLCKKGLNQCDGLLAADLSDFLEGLVEVALSFFIEEEPAFPLEGSSEFPGAAGGLIVEAPGVIEAGLGGAELGGGFDLLLLGYFLQEELALDHELGLFDY